MAITITLSDDAKKLLEAICASNMKDPISETRRMLPMDVLQFEFSYAPSVTVDPDVLELHITRSGTRTWAWADNPTVEFDDRAVF